MSPSSPSRPPPSSSQVLARLLGEDAGTGASSRGRRDHRIGIGVLALVAVTLVLLTFSVWPLIRLRSQPPRTVAEPKPDAPLIAAFLEATGKDLAQFEGRSLFAVPGPPSPRTETVRKATAPTRYGGPAIIAMINDQVWFSDGKRLGASDDAVGGLKVVSINAPWSARLEWEGAEFEVEFIARSPLLASAEESSGGRITPNPRSIGDVAVPPRAAAAAPAKPRGPGGAGGSTAPSQPEPSQPEPAPPEPSGGEPPQVAPPAPAGTPPDPGPPGTDPHTEPSTPAAPAPAPSPTEPDPEKNKS